MAISSAQMTKIRDIKGVITLVDEIRKRRDSGHFNFMSFNGKAKLLNKLSEYENYAKTAHSGKKLEAMKTELRALLGSTY